MIPFAVLLAVTTKNNEIAGVVTGKERVNSWSIDLTLLTRSKKLGRDVDELQKRERVATKQLKNRNEKTI